MQDVWFPIFIMPKVNYCPCCGYDFRNKNWVKESEILLKRYDRPTYNLIKKLINTCGKYEKVFPEDVYKFLKGISILEEKVVFEACKTYLTNTSYHPRGLNYAKYIAINLEKNKEEMQRRLRKSLGGRSKELPE